MRDVLLGILGGLGEAHQQHSESLLTQEVARRKQLAEFWKGQVENPDTRPEARDIATQKYMTIVQTPYEKKLPKQAEGLDDFLHVPQKIGQSVQTPNSEPDAGAPSPYAPGILPDVSAPIPPPQLSQETVDRWAPVSPYFGFDEKLQMQKRAGQVSNAMAGDKAYSEEKGRTRALYSPENIAGIIATEQAKKPVTIIPRGGTAVDPTGKVIGVGQPYERTPDQQMLEAASQIVAKKHGLTIKDDLGVGIFGKLPPSLQAEAAREHALMKENPDLSEIRQLTMTRDKLLNRETQLRIDDLMRENDPAAYDKIADLVNDNPDALFNYSPKEIAKISNVMLAKNYPVPRKPLNAALQAQASQADLVIQHVAKIRQLIQQYPDMIGPGMGRLGEAEEQFGASIRNLDPERAAAAQEMRTRMKYLIAQDLKALIGSRPPAKWMEELKNTSPNPRMVLPFLEGSLRGVEGSANLTLDEAYKYRYGTQPTATGRVRGGAAPAPTPPPGGAATPPASGTAPQQKMATNEDVQAYATANRIPLSEAQAAFRASGFTVLPKMKMRPR